MDDEELNNNDNRKLKVFLRIKPNAKIANESTCIKISNTTKLICQPPITSKFKEVESYKFSHIFGPETTQNEIFSKCVINCVKNLLLARNSLVFTYGTTNAGKTFTVQGSPEKPGLIPQVLHALFLNIEIDQEPRYKPDMAKDISPLNSCQKEFRAKTEILRSFHSCAEFLKSTHSNDSNHFMGESQENFMNLDGNKPTCLIWISFLEVYNETIYDLLQSSKTLRKPLKLATDPCGNFYVKGLTRIYVNNAEEAFSIYQFGRGNLNVASTKMNEKSSRSHCIFTIHVINLNKENQPSSVSKLCICDLAGIERQTTTQNTGQRLKESGNINKSIFQLNCCLRTIRDNQRKRTNQKIPYRYSTLTKLLQSALDNRTDERIIMLVNINPSAELYDETQHILKTCAVASVIKTANKPQQSSQFIELKYGRDVDAPPTESRRNELSDFEEDAPEESDELEPQDPNEKLIRVEEELSRLQKQMKICKNYHDNITKNFEESCEKIEATYKNLVKSLEKKLELQVECNCRRVEDVHNTSLESILCNCSNSVKDVLLKKNAQVEESESFIQEVKDEYILLENKYKVGKAKLRNELYDKNVSIENLKNIPQLKQNLTEDLERKIDNMEAKSNQGNVEFNLEMDRDKRLIAKNNEIKQKNLEIGSLKQRIDESVQENESICVRHQSLETNNNENKKFDTEKGRTRFCDPRRNNRTSLGKENRFSNNEEPNWKCQNVLVKSDTQGNPRTPMNLPHSARTNNSSRLIREIGELHSQLPKNYEFEMTVTPAETVKIRKRNQKINNFK